MEADRRACMDVGMDDYLSKPLRASTMWHTLERHINVARAGSDRSLAYRQALSQADVQTVEIIAGPFLSELPGDYRPYMQKTISETTVVTETEVNGRPALWLEGAHYVEFADATGQFGSEPVRLAGGVLLWERGGVTYRLEGDLTLEQALKVAEGVR
jgi:CheY-like chemotaxis protein